MNAFRFLLSLPAGTYVFYAICACATLQTMRRPSGLGMLVVVCLLLWSALGSMPSAVGQTFGHDLDKEPFRSSAILPYLTVREGENYEVDIEIPRNKLGATALVITGSLLIDGGTLQMGTKPVWVFGNVTVSSGATFAPGNAPLILDGDPTIVTLKQKLRTWTENVFTGAIVVCKGCIPHEVLSGIGDFLGIGTLVPTKRSQWYTPTLGNVHIGASPGTTFLASNFTTNLLQIGTGDVLVSSGYAITVNGTSTGGTLIYGELRVNQRLNTSTSTLFTQRHGPFETSGPGGKVIFTGTGNLLLAGTGSDAAAPFRFTVSGSLQNLTLDNGLVGYWKLDEGSGSTIARDSSRFGNHGTFNGGRPQWKSGTDLNSRMAFFNPAGLDFDGTNDYVTMGDINAIDNIRAVTYAMWVKPNSPDTTTSNFFI